jgi:serine/threonine-protein kinase RsbW
MTHNGKTSIELIFPSILGYETVARRVVATFADFVGFDQARIDDLKTAVGEACINAIEHGNQLQPDLPVYITSSYDGHRFAVDISDMGTNPLTINKDPKTIEEKLAGAASLRGMGMMLMAALADEFVVEPSTAPGNTVRLIWYQREAAHT